MFHKASGKDCSLKPLRVFPGGKVFDFILLQSLKMFWILVLSAYFKIFCPRIYLQLQQQKLPVNRKSQNAFSIIFSSRITF